MKTKPILGLMVAVCVAGMVTSALATEVTTTGFGTVPGVSPGSNPYSGSGIPFDTSEYTVVSGIPGSSDTLTIAMAATQHGSGNPAPGNNGAGTYYVSTGLNAGRSVWNFDFYINSALGSLSPYTFVITELNVGNGGIFMFDPTLIPDNVGGPSSAGNSESLDFASFGSWIGYDPNANDTYQFVLDAYLGGDFVGQSAITVVAGTGSVPDTGSTAGLMGIAVLGLVGFAKRKMITGLA